MSFTSQANITEGNADRASDKRTTLPVQSADATYQDAPDPVNSVAEAPVTFETQAVMDAKPDIADLVPSEASLRQPAAGPEAVASFPKVLRRRLDQYFTEQNISPKADRAMWVKIAVGLTVLAGSWVALYTLRPGAGIFVALYVLGGLAQTFLLLNIAHDSNHNAISSRPSVNKTLNYVFDLCGISSYMWRILHHRGHHSCINIHGEDDALTGRGLFRFTPHEPRAPFHRFQHIYGLFLYAMFSLDYVFARDFECFFFPAHDYLKRTKHPLREYVVLFAGKAFYITYMLILPVMVLHKSPWLVAGAFLLVHLIVGLSVSLVFQTTHTIDTTYFPLSRNEFDNGVYHIFATTADYATATRWWAARRRAKQSHRAPSLPLCVPYPLRSAHPHRGADSPGVRCALPATSDDDAGHPAPSPSAEATGSES